MMSRASERIDRILQKLSTSERFLRPFLKFRAKWMKKLLNVGVMAKFAPHIGFLKKTIPEYKLF